MTRRHTSLVCAVPTRLLDAAGRIPDVPAYVRALGFSPDDRLPSKTFQGTPMRHLGVHVGNFYLLDAGRIETGTLSVAPPSLRMSPC